MNCDAAGSINISDIWTGKCVAKINSSNAILDDDKKQRMISNHMVADALEEITALYFDEERNEIYTGNNHGFVHVWSN